VAKAMRINFKGVDKEIRRGGKSFRFPEGDFLFKVVKHEMRKTQSGSKGISWQMQCVSKKFKGKTIYHFTSLKPEALWNLRNLIFACTGKNVAGRALDFDPTSLYGKVFAGTTEDDSYIKDEGGPNEKEVIKSVLADIRPQEDLGGDDDKDDEDDEDEDVEVEEEDDEEEEGADEAKSGGKKDKKAGKGKSAGKKDKQKPAADGKSGKKKSKPGKKGKRDEELEGVDTDDI
jgi:hypothetical protein